MAALMALRLIEASTGSMADRPKPLAADCTQGETPVARAGSICEDPIMMVRLLETVGYHREA